MTFIKVTGIRGWVPQKFIDTSVLKCPLCGESPDWHMNEIKAEGGYRYLFQCQVCKCVLSAPYDEVKDYCREDQKEGLFVRALNLLTLGGQTLNNRSFPRGTVFFTVEERGNIQKNLLKYGVEYNLERINEFASQLQEDSEPEETED